MAIQAAARIHLQTVGDITMDIIWNYENNNAPGIVSVMEIPPLTAVNINRPILPGRITAGVVIGPPSGNTYEYNFGPDPLHLGIRFHPFLPSFIALGTSQDPIFINHVAPGPLVFTFVWI